VEVRQLLTLKPRKWDLNCSLLFVTSDLNTIYFCLILSYKFNSTAGSWDMMDWIGWIQLIYSVPYKSIFIYWIFKSDTFTTMTAFVHYLRDVLVVEYTMCEVYKGWILEIFGWKSLRSTPLSQIIDIRKNIWYIKKSKFKNILLHKIT